MDRFWAITGLLGSLLSLATAPAEAAITVQPMTEEYRIMIVTGDFEYGQDLTAIFRQIQSYGPDIVTFDSPGGNIYSAMALGRFLRSSGLTTMQLRSLECASACSLAFIGGSIRMAEPGSIGVHQSSFSVEGAASEQVAAVQSVTADVLSYLREMDVDAGLLETALRYHSSDIRYLSASEMDMFGVTTREATAVPSRSPSTVPMLPPSADPVVAETRSQASLGTIRHASETIEVRSAPNDAGTSIGLLANGTRVSIVELVDSWYRVSTSVGDGYVRATAVQVDGFYQAAGGGQFIQVLSLRSDGALNEYLQSTRIPVDVYRSVNGWYAITLKGTFPIADVKATLDSLKNRGEVPDDAFATFGNTYREKVCCD